MDGPGVDYGAELTRLASARTAVIVEGNVNDLLFFEDNTMYIRELVALSHGRVGRVPVVLSNRGVQQEPAPGQALARLRLPPAGSPPGQAIRELRDQLIGLEQPVVLVVDWADLALSQAAAAATPTADQQLLIETLAGFPIDLSLARHRLVVIARGDGLDRRLARFPGWEVLRLELPDEAARTRLAHRIAARHRETPSAVADLDDGFAPGDLGRASGGLTLDDIMRAAMAAAASGERVTRRRIQELKTARLRQRHVEGLDVYSPGRGMRDVAGLPQLRLFIAERLAVGTWPRSIILAGPTGVGKTMCVPAIADELGWPAVSFANVRSMWLGESERNIRAVLVTVRSMAPLVFHIDEVDQVLGRRETGPSTDAGTGARILAELWTFLGDAKDIRVLAVLTTNRPDLLDQATLDRSDVIPILHPTGVEQVQLLGLACAAIGHPVDPEVAREVLSTSSLRIVSGRMLVRIAQRAAILAGPGAKALAIEHLRAASEELLERADAIDHERMALKALALASFEPYLPWVAAARLGETPEAPSYTNPLLTSDGRLDRHKLDERISELDVKAAARQLARSA